MKEKGLHHHKAKVAAFLMSVLLLGCGPSLHNSKSFQIAERYEDIKSLVDSGKGEMEIRFEPTYRKFEIPVFYRSQSWKEPFFISLWISYAPIIPDFDSSSISLESVKIIDQDSNQFELTDGKDSKAFIEYLHFTKPDSLLPLGNTQIQFKLPISGKYAFKGDQTVKVRVKLRFRKTESIQVIEKKFKTKKERKIRYMLTDFNIC